ARLSSPPCLATTPKKALLWSSLAKSFRTAWRYLVTENSPLLVVIVPNRDILLPLLLFSVDSSSYPQSSHSPSTISPSHSGHFSCLEFIAQLSSISSSSLSSICPLFRPL